MMMERAACVRAFSGAKLRPLPTRGTRHRPCSPLTPARPTPLHPPPPPTGRLVGATHHVHTGVVLLVPQSGAAAGVPPGPNDAVDEGWLVRSFACTTEVAFDAVDNETLDAYIASGEPFGKAGAYGIQGLAGSFVRRIDGCFYNVVGATRAGQRHTPTPLCERLWGRGGG